MATDALPSTRDRAASVIIQVIMTAATMLVAAVPLVVLPWGHDAYSRPKVVVLYVLTGVVVLSWIVLRFVARRRWVLTRGEVALWVCLFVALTSSWTTANPRLTFFGSPARYEGLITLGAYAVLFFTGAQFFGSGARLLRLIAWAAGTGIIVAAYGIMQLFVPPLFAGEAFTRGWYGSLGFIRIPSTVGGPVIFGGYLTFVLPLTLALAAMSDRRGRALWLGGSCLAILALALTFTRGAWLASAAALATLAAGFGRREIRRHRVIVAVTALTVAASWFVLATAVATPRQVQSHVAGIVATDKGSVGARVYIWRQTLGLIGKRPVLGWGLETLREIFPYDDRDGLARHFGLRPVIVDRAHNDVLQMAVSIGIPGAVAYAVFWGSAVVAAIKCRSHSFEATRILAAGWLAGLVGYLVQAQMAFSSVAVAPVVWLIAGAVCGWEAAHRGGPVHAEVEGGRA